MVDRILIDLLSPRTPLRIFPAKASCGHHFEVIAEAVGDPHSVIELVGVLVAPDAKSTLFPLANRGNDRYVATVQCESMGKYKLRVYGWENAYLTWLERARRKMEAAQLTQVDLKEGLQLLQEARTRLVPDFLVDRFAPRDERPEAAELLNALATAIDEGDLAGGLERCGAKELLTLGGRPVHSRELSSSEEVTLDVDRERASYGNWYEAFPRSFGGFRGLMELLPLLCDAGFHVVYLPPIHPIGTTGRKGKNNSLVALSGDVGSPWAIGSSEGGHEAISSTLGGVEEFGALVHRARELDMEIALDLALQCSPDHPWVKDHPEWFYLRPDGTIATAENPPKRYEDIVPINFLPPNDADRLALWEAVLEIVELWIRRGVKIFRVDNPHTKPLQLWEWLIGEIRGDHPEVVFLAEAFTRPAMMSALAQIGFSQSYTYFTWRSTPSEVRSYAEELHDPKTCAYFRANFWPNTPDILSGILRNGTRADFELRALLGGTLAPSYGIYSGFEFLENQPQSEANEEYLDSEKYELKARNYPAGAVLLPFFKTLNRARSENPALQRSGNITFVECTNPEMLCYLREDPANDNVVVVVANFNTKAVSEGAIYLPERWYWNDPEGAKIQDYLSGETLRFRAGHNYVKLDPSTAPAHLGSLNLH